MRVAIRTGSTFGQALVNSEGRLVGEHSGLSIVRRLLKLWPRPILVGSPEMSEEPWECDGFDVVHPDRLDVNQTVIINMDVIDSGEVYRVLRQDSWRRHPKIVNLVWWNTSEFKDKIERSMIAWSASKFPTFCNSQRTELEIRGLIGRHCLPSDLAGAVVEHQNLGIEMPKGLPPQVWASNGVPTVTYPAMWLFARKRPDWWFNIVGNVSRRVRLMGKMRLHEHQLNQIETVAPWLEIGPLTTTREDYWMEAAGGDVFLATAEDESYGMQYLELLWAGQIGVFPDRPWARNILPPGYPFLYENQAQAETMMYYVLTKPADALVSMEAAFGGDLPGWLYRHHSKDDFDSELRLFVERQFPDLAKEEDDEG